MTQSKLNQINNFIVVTTCSQEGYLEYGKDFLESFSLFNQEIPLIFVQDQQIAEIHSKENIQVIQNNFASEIEVFLETFSHSCSESEFQFSPNRFIYKPTAIVSANNFLAETDYQYMVWIDADTIFKRPGLLEALKKIAPNDSQIASVFERFHSLHYLEAGLIIFNRDHGNVREYIENCCDIFISGNIFNFMEWHDAFIWSHLMNTYPPNSFRLLCKEFGILGSHPIAAFDILADKMDHLKGNNKSLGYSPEGRTILKNLQNYLINRLQNF
jgi:hypothetical protein